MRVVLVGPAVERGRLRAKMNGSDEVVGEFPTLSAAREAAVSADALVLATDAAGHVPQDFGPASRERGGHTDEGPGQSNRGAADLGVGRFRLAERLTPRELQVLDLLAEGLSNKAIAARLGISDQTAKFHVAAISGKLGASNRTAAVRLALRRGLVTI